MNNKTVIEISALTKRYRGSKHAALDNLNLNIERGEIFGYLGPNGAGKTTTIRLMLDLIRPTTGKVRIWGMDTRQDSTVIRRQVGNLPGELGMWEHLTGRQMLRYLAGLRPGCDLNYAYSLAERLGLALDVRCCDYSTGNKRKLGIIQAFMHRPRLLVLDEPTIGLDPLVRQTFHDMLAEVRADGCTVFLSSHVLAEVQAICDRVAILRQGSLQLDMPINSLTGSLDRWITVYTPDPIQADIWKDLAGVKSVEVSRGFVRLRVTGSLDEVIKMAASYTVEDVRIDTTDLEDIFMEFYHDG